MTTFFFDLDGTLCDSRPGLDTCFRAAFAAIGTPAAPGDSLERFFGPPLPAVLREMRPSIDAEGIAHGMQAFRQTFETTGIHQTPLYDGVVALLRAIRAGGHGLWLVTSKPQKYADIIVRNLGISPYFHGAVGASLAETDTKTTLVATALLRSGAAPDEGLMVGDRCYDVTGAIDNGVTPVGALWGYGSRDELAAAGCTAFAASPEDFQIRYVAGLDRG